MITSDDVGSYQEAIQSKETAANILIPLIEFEFGFNGMDSPELVQAKENSEQLGCIFEICKKHGWTNSDKLKAKGKNPYFRISKKGFLEIYRMAGPFTDNRRNEWAKLLIERYGKIGGYQKGKNKTEKNVFELLKKQNRWSSVNGICLGLRLLPSGVREALRFLNKNKVIERKKLGKTVFWKIK